MTRQPASARRTTVDPAAMKPSPRSAHQDLVEELGAQITGGAYPSGHVLLLEELAARFEVSRTVAREAVRVLESMGLIVSRRRVGLVVLPASSWNHLDPQVISWRLMGAGRAEQLRALTQLRIAIEPMAAALAARHATTAQRRRLVELSQILRREGEADAGRETQFLDADIEYHALIMQASGNDLFVALAAVIGEVLSGRTSLGLMPTSPVADALTWHEDVARGVHDGDSKLAGDTMRLLVGEVLDALEASTGMS